MRMRNPVTVAEQIRSVVPEKYHEKLDWFINDFSHKAPELWGGCFYTLSKYCNQILLDEDWKVEMISILTENSRELLLEEIT